MTPVQIEHVQSTWAMIKPISDKAGALFYGRLFALEPKYKSLFSGDITEQGTKLMQMLGAAVAGLTKLDIIVPAVQALGVRHADYGVVAEDYDTVAAALLWTLAQGLGDAFTDDVKTAWTAAYTTLAGVMIKAAEEVKAA